MGDGAREGRHGRRGSDQWTPPIHSIRSVPQIIGLDAILLAILIGTYVFVLPGTVEALYGITDEITAVHVGPGFLLLVAAAVALVSLISGAVAVSTGHPRILRGDSSPAGRFSRRAMHAALLASSLAILQLAAFAFVLPSQVST